MQMFEAAEFRNKQMRFSGTTLDLLEKIVKQDSGEQIRGVMGDLETK